MKKLGLRKKFILIGFILVLCSICVLVINQVSIGAKGKKAKEYSEILMSVMPEPESRILSERKGKNTPVYSLEGEDFIGVIEFPSFNTVLPVNAKWGDYKKYPCLFGGNLYDGTMALGSINTEGQCFFAKDISVYDKFYFTDMLGNRYSFEVSDIFIRNHAEREMIFSENSDFTLFVKNVFSFEYIIIYGKALS